MEKIDALEYEVDHRRKELACHEGVSLTPTMTGALEYVIAYFKLTHAIPQYQESGEPKFYWDPIINLNPGELKTHIGWLEELRDARATIETLKKKLSLQGIIREH